MKSESVVAAAVAGAGFAVFTVLVVRGSIGGPTYLGLVAIDALVGLVIHGFQRLRELDLKNLKLTLDRIEQVKSEIAEMYGGIEHLQRAAYQMDRSKAEDLGGSGGVPNAIATMRYVAGCFKRERERLAKVFVNEKPPEETAAAILDGSMDDLVFKWSGPESPLDAPPRSLKDRRGPAASSGPKGPGDLH